MAAADVPRHLAQNPFQDLSGVDTSAFSNPYEALLAATDDDVAELQERYSAHRTTRNAQQREKLLDPDFSGFIVDPILERLETNETAFVDPRHCLVFWARPPEHIKELIRTVQRRMRDAVPTLWLMPLENLHITILEIAHSRTAAEIEKLKTQVASAQEQVVNLTIDPSRRGRLVRPMVGFDASALALSFVPAAGDEDGYSYHHLRRDAFGLVSATGVPIQSRYVVPSAHLTIGRFITQTDIADDGGLVDRGRVKSIVEEIESINEWLRSEYWTEEGGDAKPSGEWAVGDGKPAIVLRSGTVWYGGGETVVETAAAPG